MATRRRRPAGPETTFNTHQKKAQVIIRFKPEAGIRLVGTEFTSISSADVSKINAIMKDIPGVTVNRLFEQTEAALQEKARVIAEATRADVLATTTPMFGLPHQQELIGAPITGTT